MVHRIKRAIKRWRRQWQDRSDQPKVFGLGLSRTGTTTLTMALQRLGYRVQHFPTDAATIRELNAGITRLTLLRDFDAITDITTIPFYPQLDASYPGSKFILTEREPEAWLDSLEQLLQREPPQADQHTFADQPQVAAFRRMLRERVYGRDEFDRPTMLAAYHRHLESVTRYFADRPHDLLRLDITAGEGFEKLAPFLGKPVIHEPLPRLNAKPQECGQQ